MILFQPILVIVLLAVVTVYFLRVRSTALVKLVLAAAFAIAVVLVINPGLATRLAHMVGVGRGVDLLIYLTIPSLTLLLVILFAKYREMNATLTILIREEALSHLHAPPHSERSTD